MTNYFKWTNKNENYNGFKYKDGENILKEKWNPNGRCENGGFYNTKLDTRVDYIGDVKGDGCVRQVVPNGEL